jgi:hypothetical protein
METVDTSLVWIEVFEDLPEIVGADMEDYGAFKKNCTYKMPKANAEMFVKAKKAVAVEDGYVFLKLLNELARVLGQSFPIEDLISTSIDKGIEDNKRVLELVEKHRRRGDIIEIKPGIIQINF